METNTTQQKAINKRKSQEGRLNSFIFPMPTQMIEDQVTQAYDKMQPAVANVAQAIKQKLVQSNQKIVLFSTILLLLGAAVSFYMVHPQVAEFNEVRSASKAGSAFLYITLALIGFRFSFFLYQIFLYIKYKPIESVTDALLPTVTVIVPAYNEGELVYQTLLSVANSEYPQHKMQILAVDDGSKDDTWSWMQKAKAELGDRVTIFKQPKNMGKRHALYRGFNLGTGDVFVTIDSDSIIKEDTLRNLVSPFVVNEKCGAVAGNVRVLNNQKAMIPKMLNVSFLFSFEFVRSAESSLGSVLCTPGALSAYKREAVFACLEDWINQKFMGQPSDIGEDRAMTNMILKQGKHVLFQKNAEVLTNVPEKYKGLYKMFIRWGRSNVRENIAMAKYVWSNFRQESKIGSRLLFVNQAFRLVMAYPAILFMLFFVATYPLLFLSTTLFSILILSSITVYFYARRHNLAEAFWAYTYGILFAFGLFWITPYAIATAAKRGWLTRG